MWSQQYVHSVKAVNTIVTHFLKNIIEKLF